MPPEKERIFKVMRTINWFYKDQIVNETELERWYTTEAITQLIKTEFLMEVVEIYSPEL